MLSLDFFFGRLMPAGLVVIMFGMGLNLTLQSFIELAARPRAAIAGLTAQMVLPPLVAMAIALTLPLAPGIAVGLLLLALCPGGATSNILTYLGRGDLPLSVSLTAVNSVAIVFTLPALLVLGMSVLEQTVGGAVKIPAAMIMQQLLLLTLLPIATGMAVRRFAPRIADRCEPFFRIAAVLLLVVILLALIIAQYDFFMSNLASLGAVVLLYMGVVLLLAAALSWALAVRGAQRITLLIEVGIQNTVIAVFVASTILQDNTLAVIPTTYGILMVFATAPIAWLGYRRAES